MKDGLSIIVCIKQVPETTEVDFDPETGTLKREGVAAVINPFDEYAIEEGLRLKERFGGIVRVLTMGPPQAESALRDAIAMGCDEAWLATDIAFAGADTWATSYTLSQCIKKIAPFDIVICGFKTTDGDTGQVGPELAHQLGSPVICYVNKIVDVDNGNIILKRMLDYGIETLQSELPIVITVTKEINQPRLATLRGRLNAKKTEINYLNSKILKVDFSNIGLEGSPTRVIKIFTPTPPKKGEVFEGSSEELAKKIFEKLIECNVI
jgi:electron transfer flavoprotein beta subunit